MIRGVLRTVATNACHRFAGCALCCCGGEVSTNKEVSISTATSSLSLSLRLVTFFPFPFQRAFFATLEGPGVVYLESMSFHKFKRVMQPTSTELARAQATPGATNAENEGGDGPDDGDRGPR